MSATALRKWRWAILPIGASMFSVAGDWTYSAENRTAVISTQRTDIARAIESTSKEVAGAGASDPDIGRPPAPPPSSGRSPSATRQRSSAAGWAADAIFYQIFPERFCNGDPTNDPTRESLEYRNEPLTDWQLSPWTGDWYERADWERRLGDDFYSDGAFHRRYGGDLQGVIQRLDYLHDLGVNAIYFNPVFFARSCHKYDGNSFHHVDPYFGPDPAADLAIIAEETEDPATWRWTAADKLLLNLIRRAHAREIRVVLDGVFNHTGRDFFAFADIRRHQAASRYKDWYLVQEFDDPKTARNEFRYRGWWDVGSLPEFADNAAGDDLHPGPKQYVFDTTARWMDPNGDGDPSDGIDGWRLDVARDVPVGFWRDWHELVRRINPRAYTVAEIWDDASQFLADGGFSATMNYNAFAFPVKGFLVDGLLPPSQAAKVLDARRERYPSSTQYGLLNLIDSHDTCRVASMIVNTGRLPYAKPEVFDFDTNASPRSNRPYEVRKPNAAERQIQRMVALMQMTYVGLPMIYYGTEAGMWGADDPCDRMPMVWPDMKFDPQQAHPSGRTRPTDVVQHDAALHDYYRAVIRLRRQHSALRRGSVTFVGADDAARFLSFLRSDEEETLFVGLNRSDKPYHWRLRLQERNSVTPVFTTSGNVDDISIDRQPDEIILIVPPLNGVVLEMNRGD